MTTTERVRASGFAYEETTIPPGMTVAQYRSSRLGAGRKRHAGRLGRRRAGANRAEH